MRTLTTFATGIALSVSVSLSSYANSEPYQVMAKQLHIMNNIFKSALATNNDSKGYAVSRIDSTYLKGQGALFTIQTSSRHGRWQHFSIHQPVAPLPPLPPMPDVSELEVEFISEDGEIDAEALKNIERSYSHEMEKYDHIMEQMSDQRDEQRELRQQHRELSYEMRDLEREIRELEYRHKRIGKDKEEQAEVIKELKEAKGQKQQLQKRIVLLNKEMRNFNEQQKQAKQQQEQLRQAYYQSLTARLADALCSYGNGLKSLPKDEHISVILKNAGSRAKRGYKDQILVFSKKDISACAADKIKVAKLMDKASKYQF